MSIVNYIVIQMIYIAYHCIKHRWIQVVGNVPLICEINTIYWILRANVGLVLCLIKKVKKCSRIPLFRKYGSVSVKCIKLRKLKP